MDLNLTTLPPKGVPNFIFASEKSKSYLLGAKVIVYFDHVVLQYLLTKKDAKLRLIKWILFL